MSPIANIEKTMARLALCDIQVALHCSNPERTLSALDLSNGEDSYQLVQLQECSEMVQLYTMSVTFQDSLKFYKGPLSQELSE